MDLRFQLYSEHLIYDGPSARPGMTVTPPLTLPALAATSALQTFWSLLSKPANKLFLKNVKCYVKVYVWTMISEFYLMILHKTTGKLEYSHVVLDICIIIYFFEATEMKHKQCLLTMKAKHWLYEGSTNFKMLHVCVPNTGKSFKMMWPGV